MLWEQTPTCLWPKDSMRVGYFLRDFMYIQFQFHLCLHRLWFLPGNSSFWLSTLLKSHLGSFLRITRQQNWALTPVNEWNPRCVEMTTHSGCGLSRLFIYGVVSPALPGFVLCSLYSQLTCHGNGNLSQVFGELELLNHTVIIEFHAYRNYDKWRLPVLVFCLCRARMSLKPARLLTWDGI